LVSIAKLAKYPPPFALSLDGRVIAKRQVADDGKRSVGSTRNAVRGEPWQLGS
jgi:hypothetical protein